MNNLDKRRDILNGCVTLARVFEIAKLLQKRDIETWASETIDIMKEALLSDELTEHQYEAIHQRSDSMLALLEACERNGSLHLK